MGTPLEGHWKLAFPSNYIGAHDLKGRDVRLKVSRAELEALPIAGSSKKEVRVVLSFTDSKGREVQRKMVCNKTNAKTIASLHGTHVPSWIGQFIVIYPTVCKMKGETVECIRIREKPSKTTDDVVPDSVMHIPPPEDIAALADDDPDDAAPDPEEHGGP